MKYAAGLDVSLEEPLTCVVDETAWIVKEFRAASQPEALVAALRITGLALERVGLEACRNLPSGDDNSLPDREPFAHEQRSLEGAASSILFLIF